MAQHKRQSLSRHSKRKVIGKTFENSVKALTTQVHATGATPPVSLKGFKIGAGEYISPSGIKWQFQVSAVCQKKDKIVDERVEPMTKKWAIGLHIRAYFKYLVDKAYS